LVKIALRKFGYLPWDNKEQEQPAASAVTGTCSTREETV